MGIQDIIEGKKQWRAHMARVKALPPDYQIVYKEIQRYLFKVGPVDLADGTLLSGIVDFFEEGAAAGKGVLELIGNDVACLLRRPDQGLAHLRGHLSGVHRRRGRFGREVATAGSRKTAAGQRLSRPPVNDRAEGASPCRRG